MYDDSITHSYTIAQVKTLALVTSICGIVSLLGSLTITIGVLSKRREFRRRYPVVLFLLLPMSLCDMLFSALLITYTFPVASGLTDHPLFSKSERACAWVGAAFQWTQLASFGWYTAIGVKSFRLLRSLDLLSWTSPKTNETLQQTLILLSATVLTIIPLIQGKYGPEGDSDGNECWIRGRRNLDRLTFYGPLGVALTFAFWLLIYTFVVIKRHRHALPSQKRLLLRQTAFVLIFFSCWTFPLIDRVYELFSGEESPYWLGFAHSVTGALFGFGNAVAFFTSASFRRLMVNRESSIGLLMSATLEEGVADARIASDFSTRYHERYSEHGSVQLDPMDYSSGSDASDISPDYRY